MPSDPIQAYHRLLTDTLAADCHEQLEVAQKRQRLTIGGQPICNVLRPRFLTHSQYHSLRQRVAPIMRALAKIHRAALADIHFRKQLRLTPDEEALYLADHGVPLPAPTARLNAFFIAENDLKIAEVDTETPAGAVFSDLLAEVFLTLPAMGILQHDFHLLPLPARPGMLQSVLETFRRWCGRRERPRIAVLEAHDAPATNEALLFKEYVERHGLECVVAAPRRLEFANGRLCAGDFIITLIVNRIPVRRLLAQGGPDQPVLQAVRERAACMVNPARCLALNKSASLAVLGDEKNANLFDIEERQAIADHVPWTRVMEERRTFHGGQLVDLVSFVLQRRERLVLKANDDGDGEVFGWRVGESEWERAVQAALQAPWVVQERLRVPAEPFPSLVDGKIQISERPVDTATFVSFGQHAEGCLTQFNGDGRRSIGFSLTPTFLIEAR